MPSERLNTFLSRIRALIKSRQLDRDLKDEIDFHLSMREQKNREAGMDAQEARYAARRHFGNITTLKEAARELWTFVSLESIWQDVRFAVRMLRRNPAFTVVALLTLALGIGANTAIFSVAYHILLRPLPFSDAARLVMVWEDASSYGFPRDTPAPGNFASWKANNGVFSGMAAMDRQRFDLSGEGAPVQLLDEEISANMFPLLGVQPELGRNFLPEEDKPGAIHAVILSHSLWMANFGGSPQILGQQIWLNDFAKYTIVGVMPRGFVFPDRETQIWTPLRLSDKDLANHGSHYLHVIARLKDGVSLSQANSDLGIIAQRLATQFPDSNAKVGAYATPLRDHLTGSSRLAAIVLLAAVGFVLFIACANMANLLLARATGRQKELLMRMALGAKRGRIVRQLLTESMLLSVLAGCTGLLLAVWGTHFLAYLIPDGLAPISRSGLNAEVLAFLFCVSLSCGVVFGLAPALHMSRLDILSPIKGNIRGNAGARLRDVLVVSEVALALTLLSGSALMVRSFMNVRGLDPGFRPAHVLAVETVLPFPKYQNSARRNEFFEEVLYRISHLPGVVAAGCTTWLPLTNWGGAAGIVIEGHPAPSPGQHIIPNIRMISSQYLPALGVRLIQGRSFDKRDAANTPLVALINQTAAKDFWPGENPIGARIKRDDDSKPQPWITVVGIVGDVRDSGLDEPSRPTIYYPYDQHDFFAPSYIAVRASGDPMVLASAVREQIWAVDKDQPVTHAMPLEEMFDDFLAPRKIQSSLLGAFAGFALLLAVLGIYGLLAYSVTQRTKEIGVRLALGASPGDIVRSILAQGLKLASLGVVIGELGALALSRGFRNLLFGVSAVDPITLGGTALALLAVSALACYVPAHRAMRVDPVIALRHE